MAQLGNWVQWPGLHEAGQARPPLSSSNTHFKWSLTSKAAIKWWWWWWWPISSTNLSACTANDCRAYTVRSEDTKLRLPPPPPPPLMMMMMGTKEEEGDLLPKECPSSKEEERRRPKSICMYSGTAGRSVVEKGAQKVHLRRRRGKRGNMSNRSYQTMDWVHSVIVVLVLVLIH